MPSSSPLRMLGGADTGKRLPPGETAKEVTLVLTDVQVGGIGGDGSKVVTILCLCLGGMALCFCERTAAACPYGKNEELSKCSRHRKCIQPSHPPFEVVTVRS
jgi:hypothetical protein